jgi:hypothetical protein|tara:strand:+ start:427 stop:687 length:261 start_codon:yes stop_codon:yes gene_type:complete
MRINPNNFYNRKLDFLPPHFVNTVVKLDSLTLINIEKWIYENCRGRYSITNDVSLRGNESKGVTVLGFENPGDLVLFSLSGHANKS